MTSMFSYQMQRFNQARRALMAPFPQDDENVGFQIAFDHCSHAIADFQEKSAEDRESVEDEVGESLAIVHTALDATGLVDSDTDPQGLFAVKARQMSPSVKREFSRAVDELATYFFTKK